MEKVEKRKVKETLAELEKLKEKATLLANAAKKLSTEDTHLPRVIERFKRELAEMEAEIRKLKKRG